MAKNIIVTGGAQGIGKIISCELIKNGYAVSVFEIDKEAIDEFKQEQLSKNIAIYNRLKIAL
jgi:short-subunit dehydrogenase